ncbi:hypothetical protein DV735_g791, partial [Chaetothyriales sp. CBS 134920]
MAERHSPHQSGPSEEEKQEDVCDALPSMSDDNLKHKERATDDANLKNKQRATDDDNLKNKQRATDDDNLKNKQRATDDDNLKNKQRATDDDGDNGILGLPSLPAGLDNQEYDTLSTGLINSILNEDNSQSQRDLDELLEEQELLLATASSAWSTSEGSDASNDDYSLPLPPEAGPSAWTSSSALSLADMTGDSQSSVTTKLEATNCQLLQLLGLLRVQHHECGIWVRLQSTPSHRRAERGLRQLVKAVQRLIEALKMTIASCFLINQLLHLISTLGSVGADQQDIVGRAKAVMAEVDNMSEQLCERRNAS